MLSSSAWQQIVIARKPSSACKAIPPNLFKRVASTNYASFSPVILSNSEEPYNSCVNKVEKRCFLRQHDNKSSLRGSCLRLTKQSLPIYSADYFNKLRKFRNDSISSSRACLGISSVFIVNEDGVLTCVGMTAETSSFVTLKNQHKNLINKLLRLLKNIVFYLGYNIGTAT